MTETPTPPPSAASDAPPPRRPGPGAPPPSPPFARSSTDRVLGGIGGALATRFDVEPVVVRIMLVVAALAAGGVVVPAYVLAWALVARDDDPSARAHPHVVIRDAGVLMWVVVVLMGVAVIDGVTDPFDTTSAFPLLPLVLIGIGVALWTRGGTTSSGPSASWPTAVVASGAQPAATATVSSTAAPSAAVDDGVAGPPVAAGSGAPPPRGRALTRDSGRPPSPGRTPPPRSPLGAVTVALALIAAGVAVALDTSTSLPIDLGTTGAAAVALLVLGLGLLVGSVWGRARWLWFPSFLLLPVVLVGGAVAEFERSFDLDLDASAGVGERQVTFVGDEPVPPDLDLLAGSVDLDLGDWRPDSEQLAAIDRTDPDLVVSVGLGEVVLVLPPDVAWRVTSDVGLGELEVRRPGSSTSSTTVDDLGAAATVVEGGPDGGPVYDVTVDVGLGQVTIVETPPTTTSDEELS